MTIENASSMDRPVPKARGLSLRAILLLAGGGVLMLGFAAALPSIVRWSRAELVVDGSRIRTGVAVRGDLERDVSAQGRIVAALHPTLFALRAGSYREGHDPARRRRRDRRSRASTAPS